MLRKTMEDSKRKKKNEDRKWGKRVHWHVSLKEISERIPTKKRQWQGGERFPKSGQAVAMAAGIRNSSQNGMGGGKRKSAEGLRKKEKRIHQKRTRIQCFAGVDANETS